MRQRAPVALAAAAASAARAARRSVFPVDSAARHTRRADSRRALARLAAARARRVHRARRARAALARLWREIVVIDGENVAAMREQWVDPAARAAGKAAERFGLAKNTRGNAPRRRRDPAVAEAEAEGYTPAPRGTLSRLGAMSPLPFSPEMLSPYSPASPRAWTRGAARAAREPLARRAARAAAAAAARAARRVEARARAFATRLLNEIASRVPDMGTDARRTLDMTVFACLCVIPVCFAYVSALRKSGLRVLVLLAGATCFVCYYATRRLTGTVQRLTLQRGMFGYDINKKGTPAGDVRVPEAAGLAPAAVFLASLSVLQVAHMWLGGEGAKEWAVEHNSALATIGFAVFLGFVDDVLELPWRAKMILPAFSAMPLLLSYAGSTTISVSYTHLTLPTKA